MTQSHKNSINTITENIDLAIIAPDGKDGMIQHASECIKKIFHFYLTLDKDYPCLIKMN